jgi:uncharacterized membrane protein YukC
MRVKIILAVLLVVSNVGWFIVYRAMNERNAFTRNQENFFQEQYNSCMDARMRLTESLASCALK